MSIWLFMANFRWGRENLKEAFGRFPRSLPTQEEAVKALFGCESHDARKADLRELWKADAPRKVRQIREFHLP